MGVQGLNQYLLHNVPKDSKIIQKKYLYQLSNRTISIDASIYIYKFFIENDYNMLKNGINTMINDFRTNKITPIFVFDGKPTKMKEYMINKRRSEKHDAELEYNNVNTNTGEKEKLKKMFIKPNKATIDFVKVLLNKNKIKYIDAPNEADPICAWLVNTGHCWACLSDDTDMFIYGCPRVLRSYSINTKSLMLYQFDDILKRLKLTFTEFREICVISGTDYNANNININSVFNLFYKYKKILKETTCEPDNYFINWLINNDYINDEINYSEILDLMDISNLRYSIPS
jgi:5'-3' exonuclease